MDADQLAARRRQAYWRRRRQFEAKVRRGSLLAVDKMDHQALGEVILVALHDLEMSARDRSNVADWTAAQGALEAFHEIVRRGEQLHLPIA